MRAPTDVGGVVGSDPGREEVAHRVVPGQEPGPDLELDLLVLRVQPVGAERRATRVERVRVGDVREQRVEQDDGCGHERLRSTVDQHQADSPQANIGTRPACS